MIIRGIFGFLIIAAFLGGISPAYAIDNVDRAIVKCRTSANTMAEQVTCLETALRNMVPSTGEPDWGAAPPPVAATESAIGTAPAGVAKIVPKGIGSEQVRRADKNFAREKITSETSIVADFAYNQSDRLIIVLRNGQVWKQRTSDLNYVRLKRGETPRVLVRPGAISGYRMEFLDKNETITVSRIQ